MSGSAVGTQLIAAVGLHIRAWYAKAVGLQQEPNAHTGGGAVSHSSGSPASRDSAATQRTEVSALPNRADGVDRTAGPPRRGIQLRGQ